MSDRNTVLEVEGLGIDFGGLTAVNNFRLTIEKKQIAGLIGPNGAGKTTVFNMLTKVYEPSRGKIVLNGEDITKKTPIEVSKAGIARTFQNIRLFNELSVEDNVKVGMHNRLEYSPATGVFRLPRYYAFEKMAHEKALELLDIFDLRDQADIKASSLPYGAQRRLEIARALASDPCLLLLDEPAAGMNPRETADLMETIRLVRDKFDIAILLIEHDMKLVMGICEKITVINYGMILTHGTPEEVRTNKEVIRAYLGE